jgi:hypothetical protein
MPTTIDSAGITFNDTTSLTSANIGTAQLVNGSVTASKLGTNEQKQICKAWVNFDGTTSPGTIRSSYNVSSVTKNGTGDYTVNFATAMADANYTLYGSTNTYNTPQGGGDSVTIKSATRNSSADLMSTSQIRIQCGDNGFSYDYSYVNVSIFGN